MPLQIPVAPPPGIDAGMYQQALAYLKANPEVAMQTQEQVISTFPVIIFACRPKTEALTGFRRGVPGMCHDRSVRSDLGVHVQMRRMGNPMMAQAASANLQDPEYRCRPVGRLALRMHTASSSAHRSMHGSRSGSRCLSSIPSFSSVRCAKMASSHG